MPQVVTATPRLLLGPGPANVDPRVLQALAAPLQGHLDPEFLDTLDAIKQALKQLFRTESATTLVVSGTGSAGMEACLVNTVEPGSKVLVGVGGYFGARICEVARRLGAEVVEVNYNPGQPLDPGQMIEALKAHPDARIVAVVHAETSTGILQPLEEIGKAVAETDALFMVDCVTSLGGAPVEFDRWHIDIAYSSSQKCIGMVPGLAPVAFSEKAVQVAKRRGPSPSFYLGLDTLLRYWDERQYHHTACSTLYYGLLAALQLIFDEQLENRWRRHREVGESLQRRLEEMGCKLFAAEGYRLPMLTAVLPPDGVDAGAVRRALLERFNIEVGAGLGEWKDKLWRIGMMGYNARPEMVDTICGAIKAVM